MQLAADFGGGANACATGGALRCGAQGLDGALTGMPLPSEGGPPGPHCGGVCCACQFRAATIPSVSVVGVGRCSSPAEHLYVTEWHLTSRCAAHASLEPWPSLAPL